MIEIIEDKSAWKGPDIKDDPCWQYSLEESDLEEIGEALRHCKVHMVLAEGDVQFINNHVIYHSRTAFENDPGSGRQRCLWRVWLSAPHRALPPSHSVLWGSVESGEIRGGIGLSTGA